MSSVCVSCYSVNSRIIRTLIFIMNNIQYDMSDILSLNTWRCPQLIFLGASPGDVMSKNIEHLNSYLQLFQNVTCFSLWPLSCLMMFFFVLFLFIMYIILFVDVFFPWCWMIKGILFDQSRQQSFSGTYIFLKNNNTNILFAFIVNTVCYY